jgi:N-methylhydantoinase A
MMESGPAGGVVGTMALCELLDLEAAIAFDMGGTTAKASVIRRGVPSLSPDYFIGGYNEGLGDPDSGPRHRRSRHRWR